MKATQNRAKIILLPIHQECARIADRVASTNYTARARVCHAGLRVFIGEFNLFSTQYILKLISACCLQIDGADLFSVRKINCITFLFKLARMDDTDEWNKLRYTFHFFTQTS